jgi:hypothetical protein
MHWVRSGVTVGIGVWLGHMDIRGGVRSIQKWHCNDQICKLALKRTVMN